ncbi:DUF3387 domain-containing protein [Microbacterium sp. NPDC089695]|uniref:DUF3387 domain-containing protein n=1 Tax=Microbacterium sp. NPDC089695 TaxID=3364198 RepID=UPI0037F44C3A
MGEDVRVHAIPAMRAEHSVVDALLHGYHWRSLLSAGGSRAFINALAGALDHLLSASMVGAPPGVASEKGRFLTHASRFVRLYALCAGTFEAEALKTDAAFFEAVRAQLAKLEGGDRRSDPNAEAETAIRQIVSDAMAGAGVVDIFEEAGLSRPDLSLIDDDFIARFQSSDRKNLQLEALRRLLSDQISNISKRNLVAGRQFSELLGESILRYQNRALDSAQVIHALADLAQRMTAEANRAASLGLSEDELAFYDAIRSNDAAVLAIGDEKLRSIAHDLVQIVRRDAKTDWTVKEQVRAKLRATIKRLLRRHGYPPDRADIAITTVIRQAEALATTRGGADSNPS